ncbi:MAG TPA: AAA family ATPase [Thermoleophilaceae bacterium]
MSGGSAHESSLPALLEGPQRSRFVGRQLELERLGLALERAGEIPRQLVLVVGEPGIGKSRILTQFAHQAVGSGARVLYGRTDPDGLFPYGPFVEALGGLFPDTDLMSGGDSAQARLQLFDAVSALIAGTTGEQPVLLMLEDLHWADEPTLLLLRHVLRSPDERRLLVVSTSRDAELYRSPALDNALAEIEADVPVERIHLRGLAVDDVAALAREAIGREPDAGVARSIHEETSGNPFFVLELASHVAESPSGEAPLPESVREVILSRLRRLTWPTQRALSVAAALGAEFDLELLERVVNVERDALEQAGEAGLVGEVPQRPARYAFAHALTRTVLYSQLSAPPQVHEQIARCLEEWHEAGRDVRLADISSHYMWALPRGDAAHAIDFAARTAEESTAMLAYEDAAAHLARALSALDEHIPDDTRRRARLLLDLGHAQRRSGRMPEARETFMSAVEAARELGDATLLAQAVLGYGGGFFESAYVDETMVALLEEAIAAIPAADSVLRLELLSRLAKALYYSEHESDEPRRIELSSEAIAMAERLDDPRGVLVALEGRHFALTQPENLEERVTIARRIIELAGECADRERELLGRYFLISDLVEADRLEEADTEIAEYGRLAEEAKLPLHLWYSARFRAMRALLCGRFDKASALAQEAFELGSPVEPRTAAMHFGAQLWLLNYLQGTLEPLEDAVRGFVAEYPRVPAWKMGLTFLLLASGRRAEAAEIFQPFRDERFRNIPRDAIWSVTTVFAAELVVAGLGDEDDAAALYDLLAPYADRNAVTGETIFCAGPMSLYVGRLELFRGNAAAAVKQLEDAVERCRRVGAHPFEQLARASLEEAIERSERAA